MSRGQALGIVVAILATTTQGVWTVAYAILAIVAVSWGDR